MVEQSVLGFAGLLRQLRAEARLTQEELADAAGLSPRSVSDLERGINRTARKDTAELLARALGLAEPARAVFVAAARGRAPAAEVLAAMRGKASLAPETPAPGESLVWSGCPYLGLVPFEERDARVFYGRGELVAQLSQRLCGRLDGPGMLLVAGESGAGKSSLLRAGLMPWLAAGALVPGSQRWPRRVIRPADRPLRELAMVLAEMAGADPVSVYRSLSAAPDEAPMLVEQAVRIAAGRGPTPGPAGPGDVAVAAPPRLVLVVDQFEELFTAGEDGDAGRVEREAFIAALDAAATVPAGPQALPAALVVAAVRVDFLGRLVAYPPLKAALEAGPFMVGPMSEAELRLAITGPAAEAGLAVEPALDEAVIAELREGTGGGPGRGVLPLMSQAMAATWQRREGSTLTLRGYRRAGGVADAVNRSAQAAYDTLTGSQKDAARQVFTQLTVITPDGQLARRRCRRADLRAPGSPMAAGIDAVIDLFSAQRLLVLGQDSVEIAHDALLQAWKQLRDWLGDDQLDRALYSQVITDADTWDSNGRDPSYLYRPGRLAAIDAATTRWQRAPARYPPLPATSTAFVDAAHHAARRNDRRRRSGVAILALLTALAVTASGVAFNQRAAAVKQRDQAIYNQVVAEALQLGTTDTALAAQLNLAAYRIQPTQDLASRLLNTENTPLPSPLATGGGVVTSVAFSPRGNVLASGNDDGKVRLWDVTDPTHSRPLGQPLTGATSVAWSVAFSADGHTLASGNDDGSILLWDITDPAHPRPLGQPLTGGTSTTWSVAFSADGHTLASGNDDGTVRLWDVADPAHPGPLGPIPTGGSPVTSVTFSSHGSILASGSADGIIRLWTAADSKLPSPLGQPLTGGSGAVESVAFSPDGHTLASGSVDGTIRLWSLPQTVITDSTLGRNSVAFSPDGHTLASGDNAGTVRLRDIADPAHPRPLGPPLTGGTGAAWSVAFSPDGHTLAIGSSDGSIRLWDTTDPAHPRPLGPPLTGGISAESVAFSADGHTLASGSLDGAVRLRDIADPAHPRPRGSDLNGDTGANSVGASSVAFSPAGHTLAVGNSDGTVRLWDVTDPVYPRTLGPVRASAGGISVESVAFSPDGHTLASGDGAGTVRLWEVADPVRLRPLGQPLTGAAAAVGSLAFSLHGSLLASGNLDGAVRLWEVADPAQPRPLGQPLTGSAAAVGSLAFSPDGHTLASGSGDGTRLWNLSVQYAIDRICSTAGGLTARQWNEYIPQLRYQPSCTH
jgi:WD40 repeat protein/transcriptional regulator with XRE-family HTH domain